MFVTNMSVIKFQILMKDIHKSPLYNNPVYLVHLETSTARNFQPWIADDMIAEA